jgi:dynactin-6
MSSSRRPGATAHPKPPTSFAPGLIISDTAFVIGSKLITIGDHTVVHPRAHVASYFGPTTVGTGCILGERCYVGLQSPLPEQPEGVLLGDYVIVEIGAVVEARRVGEGSILETNSKVCKGAVLGKVMRPLPVYTSLLHHTNDLLVALQGWPLLYRGRKRGPSRLYCGIR